MILKFVSDASAKGRGFKAVYKGYLCFFTSCHCLGLACDIVGQVEREVPVNNFTVSYLTEKLFMRIVSISRHLFVSENNGANIMFH